LRGGNVSGHRLHASTFQHADISGHDGRTKLRTKERVTTQAKYLRSSSHNREEGLKKKDRDEAIEFPAESELELGLPRITSKHRNHEEKVKISSQVSQAKEEGHRTLHL